MINLNNVTISGMVQEDPKRFTTKNNFVIVRMRIQSNKEWTDKERQSHTIPQYFSIKAVGETAEFIAACIHSGNNIVITGVLATDSWVDKDDKKHFDTLIEARQVVRVVEENAPAYVDDSDIPPANPPSRPTSGTTRTAPQPQSRPRPPQPPRISVPNDVNAAAMNAPMMTEENNIPF